MRSIVCLALALLVLETCAGKPYSGRAIQAEALEQDTLNCRMTPELLGVRQSVSARAGIAPSDAAWTRNALDDVGFFVWRQALHVDTNFSLLVEQMMEAEKQQTGIEGDALGTLRRYLVNAGARSIALGRQDGPVRVADIVTSLYNCPDNTYNVLEGVEVRRHSPHPVQKR